MLETLHPWKFDMMQNKEDTLQMREREEGVRSGGRGCGGRG